MSVNERTAEEWGTEARSVWNNNASWWHSEMERADLFHRAIIHPAVWARLGDLTGKRVLDVACGNGLLSLDMACKGADVVGFDFSDALIALAREQSSKAEQAVEFRALDATSTEDLGRLSGPFDAAVCVMALHDIHALEALAEALERVLEPGGVFVFAVPHPCFNSPATIRFTEQHFGERWSKVHGVRVTDYGVAFTRSARIKESQPAPQPVFHRPLGKLLEPFLRAGLLCSHIAEPGPERSLWNGDADSLEALIRIPPVMVVELRKGT